MSENRVKVHTDDPYERYGHQGKFAKYLDFDPKLGGASIGTLLAIVVQDVARRAGMEVDATTAVAYSGLIVAFVTWMVPRRND